MTTPAPTKYKMLPYPPTQEMYAALNLRYPGVAMDQRDIIAICEGLMDACPDVETKAVAEVSLLNGQPIGVPLLDADSRDWSISPGQRLYAHPNTAESCIHPFVETIVAKLKQVSIARTENNCGSTASTAGWIESLADMGLICRENEIWTVTTKGSNLLEENRAGNVAIKVAEADVVPLLHTLIALRDVMPSDGDTATGLAENVRTFAGDTLKDYYAATGSRPISFGAALPAPFGQSFHSYEAKLYEGFRAKLRHDIYHSEDKATVTANANVRKLP